MPLVKPDKKNEKRPRVLLIPPADLPVPAVHGGAVETLITHLIRENERQGKLDLLCVSVLDPDAKAAAADLHHTKMMYIARPRGHRRYWPMVFIERCFGIAAPYEPWYQKVQLSLALELPPPDWIIAEGGNLTQCSAISRMFGRKRCLAHLHGLTQCSRQMDEIYGGVQEDWQSNRIRLWKSEHKQTWSATGYLHMIFADILGLQINGDQISFSPYLPEGITSLEVSGLLIRGKRYRVHVTGAGRDTKAEVSILE